MIDTFWLFRKILNKDQYALELLYNFKLIIPKSNTSSYYRKNQIFTLQENSLYSSFR